MTNIRIVPATEELLTRYYGNVPAVTVRAVVGLKDDEIVGVAGVYIKQSAAILFSEMSDDLKKDKRAMVLGARGVLSILKTLRVPVVSLADTEIEGSEVLLKHIGFKESREGVHQWHG